MATVARITNIFIVVNIAVFVATAMRFVTLEVPVF